MNHDPRVAAPETVHDHADALARLHHHYQSMPPVAAMAVTIAGYDGQRLRLHAPLSTHVNDKGCAFGGSLASMMTLASWGLVSLHVLAVLFYLIVRRRNLILPMITGRKAGVPEPARGGGALRGGVVLAAAAAAVYLVVTS